MIAANMPKAFKGMIGVKLHETNAMAEVKEVTNIALNACLNVYESFRIGSFLMALILNVESQKSWKTKISSAPIPMTTSRAATCIYEKYVILSM